jgi:hypothetical protein
MDFTHKKAAPDYPVRLEGTIESVNYRSLG